MKTNDIAAHLGITKTALADLMEVSKQTLNDYISDILFNLKTIGWNDSIPFGKYKGKLLKEVPDEYLNYLYFESGFKNFNREVILFITSNGTSNFPRKFVKKEKVQKSSGWYGGGGYDACNPLELDAWAGFDFNR